MPYVQNPSSISLFPIEFNGENGMLDCLKLKNVSGMVEIF